MATAGTRARTPSRSSTSSRTSASTSASTSTEPPAPTTRERILDVAQRRFIEQGYDGTSLREIADELGFTKAALYYHFQTKEQIFAALLKPADDLIDGMFTRLEAATDVTEWADAIYWVIDRMHENFDFFRLVERNRAVLEHLERDEGSFMADHAEMHRRFEQTVQELSPDLPVRMRLVTSIAAVTGFDDWAPTILFESDRDEVIAGLKEIVRVILGLPKPRKR